MTARDEREYTAPIALGAGHFEIDTTPDGEGDIEVYSRDGDHVAYLDPTDQLTLRDLLNRLHPLEPRTITTAEELDALPSGSVILDPAGLSLHKNEFTGWRASNGARDITADMLHHEALPATVLYEPEPRP